MEPEKTQNSLLKREAVNRDGVKAVTPPEIGSKKMCRAVIPCIFFDNTGSAFVRGFPVLTPWFRGGRW